MPEQYQTFRPDPFRTAFAATLGVLCAMAVWTAAVSILAGAVVGLILVVRS